VVREFMRAIAAEAREPGRIYFAGGASVVLKHWRESTVDIDFTIIPENDRILRAISDLKKRLHVNVELSCHSDPAAERLQKVARGRAKRHPSKIDAPTIRAASAALENVTLHPVPLTRHTSFSTFVRGVLAMKLLAPLAIF
jgi:hypothetical protein